MQGIERMFILIPFFSEAIKIQDHGTSWFVDDSKKLKYKHDAQASEFSRCFGLTRLRVVLVLVPNFPHALAAQAQPTSYPSACL